MTINRDYAPVESASVFLSSMLVPGSGGLHFLLPTTRWRAAVDLEGPFVATTYGEFAAATQPMINAPLSCLSNLFPFVGEHDRVAGFVRTRAH